VLNLREKIIGMSDTKPDEIKLLDEMNMLFAPNYVFLNLTYNLEFDRA
jgi:hypothetical protein